MAIERENKPVEEKNNMKVTDNMDGEERANEKLNSKLKQKMKNYLIKFYEI